ncbi:MAG: ATP cone domain-containing protein [Gemmatales bacterium]|nr:ATP cone domain-containing protein [Gemmatales bacterium]MDW8388069.1 ATP cone domain-containing protein [Gemmatales bacterium]
MSDPRRSEDRLPVWVRKRDGRLEPFDSEKINRTLFAALESLGRPDAFVARELTDGILHFLAAESEGPTISAGDLEEWVVKIVRELGHPDLAAAYAERARHRDRQTQGDDFRVSSLSSPLAKNLKAWLHSIREPERIERLAAGSLLEDFTLHHVLSRHVTAAATEGLLHLGGLARPRELSAALCRLFSPSEALPSEGVDPFGALRRIRRYVGDTVAFAAPERDLALMDVRIGEIPRLVRDLHAAAGLLGLNVVLNLGHDLDTAEEEPSRETLFVEQDWGQSTDRLRGFREVLVEEVLALEDGSTIGLDWHLCETDFQSTEGRRRLGNLLRAALRGRPIRFVCRRGSKQTPLGDGLHRSQPAVLLWVGLDLEALRRRIGKPATPEDLALRTLSLARLAASAGVQKRDFIRNCGQGDWPPFLLDRAAVGLRLHGLDHVLEELHGPQPFTKADAWAFAVPFAKHLTESLRQESRRLPLPVVFDDQFCTDLGSLEATDQLGQTARQLGKWHEALGSGTWRITLPQKAPDGDKLVNTLSALWKRPGICRIAFTASAPAPVVASDLWREGA